MKADPYATYAEVPPENASIVYRSRLRVVGRRMARRAGAPPIR